MTVVMFRQPVNGTYQYVQTLHQGTIIPLAFPDITIAVSRLL
jgi:hypothetical protein